MISGAGPRETVGGHLGIGVDFESKPAHPISWAEGSFPVVNGLTSVTDTLYGAGEYSLQLNANRFTSPTLCAGAGVPANCRGWEQFAYTTEFGTFIEYWLLNYNHTCPSGWNTYTDFTGNTDCYRNSQELSTPLEPITNLTNMTLVGMAGGSDSVLFSNGNDTLFAFGEASVLGLGNGGWTSAEFNVFGMNGGSQANFNANVSMVVQTLTNTTPATTAAPSWLTQTETGETNSLSLTSTSICLVSGNEPGIQFTQSNNGAGNQSCPLPPSQLQLPVAFQANTNFLWLDRSGSGSNQGFGMQPGTVPSLVTIPGGVAVGFQANTRTFWLDQAGVGTNSGHVMQGTTSPSIARLLGGQIAIAFQGSNGHLWVGTNGPLSAVDTGFAMMAGTNPSLAAISNGQYAVGFQGSNGHLWLDQSGGASDSGRVMQASSSPSVAVWPDENNTILVAFQGSNGDLWVGENGVFSSFDTGFGMKANTSPSAAIMDNGEFIAIAFQANTSHLWVYNGAGTDTGLGMNATASPTVSALPGGGYQVAFKAASTGNLWVDVNGAGFDQHLGMN